MLLCVTDGCRDALLYLNPEAQQSPREDVTSSVDTNDFVNANLKIPPSRACSADSAPPVLLSYFGFNNVN